jgi:hypothetical protein
MHVLNHAMVEELVQETLVEMAAAPGVVVEPVVNASL